MMLPLLYQSPLVAFFAAFWFLFVGRQFHTAGVIIKIGGRLSGGYCTVDYLHCSRAATELVAGTS
jgi:hypothetical protein